MPPSSPQATLLVDGYNVIGTWTDLKKIRDVSGLDAARQGLVEILINYSAFVGYKTEVVFDAQYQNTRLYCEALTSHLSICFTAFGQTADTFIEKFCASFRHQPSYRTRRLIVATSDRAQQLTVVGYGAEWLSSEQLAHEVASTASRVRRKHRPEKQSRARFLFNSLDTQSQQRLAKLRQGIR